MIWLSFTNRVSDNNIQIYILILRPGALSSHYVSPDDGWPVRDAPLYQSCSFQSAHPVVYKWKWCMCVCVYVSVCVCVCVYVCHHFKDDEYL